MIELPKTRKDAKRLGIAKYFTGMPCKRGHVSPRHVGGDCISCNRENVKSYRASERGRLVVNRMNARSKRKHLDAVRERHRNYYAKERHRYIENAKLRSDRIRNKAPAWIDRRYVSMLRKICMRVTECTGVQWEIDHLIPLQGELVSGLHVHSNLQLLPAYANRLKSNKYDENTSSFCL